MKRDLILLYGTLNLMFGLFTLFVLRNYVMVSEENFLVRRLKPERIYCGGVYVINGTEYVGPECPEVCLKGEWIVACPDVTFWRRTLTAIMITYILVMLFVDWCSSTSRSKGNIIV